MRRMESKSRRVGWVPLIIIIINIGDGVFTKRVRKIIVNTDFIRFLLELFTTFVPEAPYIQKCMFQGASKWGRRT